MTRYSKTAATTYRRFGVGKNWFRTSGVILANSWFAILVGALIGGLLGLTFSVLQRPTYQSTAVLYQTPVQGDSDLVVKQRTQGIVAMLTSDRLLSAALRSSGLRMSVSEAREATAPAANVGSSVVNIVTTTNDPEVSARLANALATALPPLLRQLDGNPPAVGSPATGGVQLIDPRTGVPIALEQAGTAEPAPQPNTGEDAIRTGPPPPAPIGVPAPLPNTAQPPIAVQLSMITPAVPSATPVAPKFGRNITLGIVAGLLTALFISYLRAHLRHKIEDGYELSEILGAPLLASIPLNRHAQGPCVVDFSRPKSPATQAFRRLRTNIDGSELLTGKRRIVVTSPTGQDGKTTTAVNLALALAAGGSSVVLVDAALSRASTEQSGDSDVSGDVRVGGLVGYIRADNGNDIMVYTEPTRYAGVRVIYAGQDVADHTEMLGTDRLRHGLEELAARFDFVIVDSASMHSSSDALVLARHADAVLLVVRSNKTHYIDLGSSLELLDSSGIPLVGVVLNGYPTNGLRAAFGRIQKSVSVRQMLTGPIHPVRQSGDDSRGDQLVAGPGGGRSADVDRPDYRGRINDDLSYLDR